MVSMDAIFHSEWPHQPHVARITTKVSTINLPPHKHEWKSRTIDQNLQLHHKKEKMNLTPKIWFC